MHPTIGHGRAVVTRAGRFTARVSPEMAPAYLSLRAPGLSSPLTLEGILFGT